MKDFKENLDRGQPVHTYIVVLWPITTVSFTGRTGCPQAAAVQHPNDQKPLDRMQHMQAMRPMWDRLLDGQNGRLDSGRRGFHGVYIACVFALDIAVESLGWYRSMRFEGGCLFLHGLS